MVEPEPKQRPSDSRTSFFPQNNPSTYFLSYSFQVKYKFLLVKFLTKFVLQILYKWNRGNLGK